jgi:hypothetical protein
MRTRRQELFITIRTEGSILPPDILHRVAAGDSELGGLNPESYHLGATERLNEAITRSWNRLVGTWTAFRDAREKLPESDVATSVTRERWLLPLFQELGYGRLQPARGVEVDGKSYPISHDYGAVPIHLVGYRIPLDQRSRGVAGAAGQSPHGLVQELLNRSPGRLYGVVSNGLVLRLLRDNTSLIRQAYVEFDLESMFVGEVYADFGLLWLICHQSRVEGERPEDCWLERWSKAAAQQGTRALEGLREGVEEAIEALGRGFLTHSGNNALRDALRSGRLAKQDFYRELLRLVYRLLFLFVAEDRRLLRDPDADPAAWERYELYYSTARLRRLAERRRGTRHGDLWQALRLVMKFLGEDAACPALGLPPLGSFLWSRRAVLHLEDSSLANRDLLEALRALAFREYGAAFRVVDYKNLGTEELGSVYESLLELHPEVNVDAGMFSLATVPGHERKTTGSYYTPPSLVQELLNSALDPVLEEAAKSADPEAAILDMKVCDPACGSGHFLVAAAHRIARRLAVVRTGDTEPTPDAIRKALRDVAGQCIYGVDANEMAVELCKVSLWMEALDPGRPLSFLDNHIQSGNSLIGANQALIAKGIPDAAFEPIEGDNPEFAAARRKENRQDRNIRATRFIADLVAERPATYAALPEEFVELDEIPDDSITGLHRKEERYRRLEASADYRHVRLIADAWCAAFFWWKHSDAPPPITHDLFLQLQANLDSIPATTRDEVARLAERYRFFHWHLAFPKIFRVPAEAGSRKSQSERSGGFDVVLGNPPWERVKLQEKEFFEAAGHTDIAHAHNKAERQRLINRLKDEDRVLWLAYRDALRQAEAESHFFRISGRYPLTGRGDVNTYAVFAECMRSLISSRGRVGCIIPTGIATDDPTKHFFADLVTPRTLVSLYDFRNKGFFPDVAGAQGNRFCLLTVAGSARPVTEAVFVFRIEKIAELHDPERKVVLTAQDFELLNPNTRTCPIFRTRRDAEITKGIYRRVPVLVNEAEGSAGNPWSVEFRSIFHMANDSHLFRIRERLEAEGFRLDRNIFSKGGETWLPLYEAKMVHHYNHRFGDYALATIKEGKEVRQIPHAPAERLEDPDYLPLPRYWVPAVEVDSRLAELWAKQWLFGWRNITSGLDERTVIGAVIPKVGASNSLPLAFCESPSSLNACFVGNLSSLAFDYLARQKIGGTNLAFFIVQQLPVIPPSAYTSDYAWSAYETVGVWLRSRVLELVYTARDLKSFANDLGYDGPPFRWDPERRFLLRCELDSAFFHLYGISREDADYILDTFPIVQRNDEAKYGEYRTKRVVLEVYDIMARAIETSQPYQTVLDPQPADPRGTTSSRGRRGANPAAGPGGWESRS